MRIQITSLVIGQTFRLDDSQRVGTYLGTAGDDAKVEWEGKVINWSGQTSVYPVSVTERRLSSSAVMKNVIPVVYDESSESDGMGVI